MEQCVWSMSTTPCVETRYSITTSSYRVKGNRRYVSIEKIYKKTSQGKVRSGAIVAFNIHTQTILDRVPTGQRPHTAGNNQTSILKTRHVVASK